MSDFLSRRNLDFVLYELLGIESLCDLDEYSSHDRQTFDSVIDAAADLADRQFAPHASAVDEQEPMLVGNKVHIISNVKDALDEYYASGFGAVSFPESVGGMQLPAVVAMACEALFLAGNVSTASYPMLTRAAANLLNTYGSEKEKALFLKPMLEGRFFGTMCLSEPQAGSSLADIRTRAEPNGNGTYRISGSKMWISGGDHSMSENIVHMVLAKIPGGPEGVKGISLFVVPKFEVHADGSIGEKNDVSLAGLNHKMGYRGTVNTALNFGEKGNCRGDLVGEPHRGLEYMFQMMNESRIAVGLGATAIGYAGYMHSKQYAEDRPQGRKLDNRDPSAPQIPIIEHADVRRLLLSQKSYVEGALALMLYCSTLVDQAHSGSTTEKRDAGLLLDVLTPIAKSWPSEFCLEANKQAIQVLGGYGYSREYPVERLYRDNRLNAIHEGTHGIQAIDLLGRKVMMNNGDAFDLLLGEIEKSVDSAKNLPELVERAEQLQALSIDVSKVTAHLGSHIRDGRAELALANATLYLDAVGHLVIGWLWLRQAIIAADAQARAGDVENAFYGGKLSAFHYFYSYELPHASVWLKVARDMDETCLRMRSECF